jgi:hypothetical protein
MGSLADMSSCVNKGRHSAIWLKKSAKCQKRTLGPAFELPQLEPIEVMLPVSAFDRDQ